MEKNNCQKLNNIVHSNFINIIDIELMYSFICE
jgi:hypothetical protein